MPLPLGLSILAADRTAMAPGRGIKSQFSNRGLCVKRFCKPLVCRASAGSWFSPRSAHGRRMMGRRGSAFQGLKRGPRAAAN